LIGFASLQLTSALWLVALQLVHKWECVALALQRQKAHLAMATSHKKREKNEKKESQLLI
jgi:hypothetical protein